MSTQTDPAADPSSGVESVYVLSPVQLGMVFHDLYSPDSGAYLNQYVFSLRGRVDPAGLRRAWEHVLLHSPVLRTAVVWEGVAQPVQVVFRRAALPWEAHDWRGAPEDERRERLHRFLEDQRGSGFDLLRPPLMRLALLRLGDEAFELVWTYHHVLLDGWSISLVLQDVLAGYDSLRRGGVPALPRRRPYADYIAWLQRQDLAAAEAYWRGVLQGFASPTPLGVDRAPGAAPAGRSAFGTAERHLSAGATAGLRAFAKRHRLTVNTLVQGAWGLLLSRYSGEEDVVFGATVAGRPPGMAGMEAMVGLFINTLPVRLRVEGWRSMDGWLRQLQAEQQDARAYEYSPLPEVRRWSEVPAGVPLFESIVAFENHPVEEVEGGAARGFAVAAWSRGGQGHYPLALLVLPGERTGLQLEYDGARIAADAAARMAGHLEAVLEAMAAGPARRLSEVSLLRGAERVQVLEAWNDTAAAYPRACVHELVSAQAARTPDSVAVVFEGGSLTYAALETRSDRLARHLRRLGVGAETRVGVCAERSAELVVALLGVLKAGGAYVPLDPSYPAERLALMLGDSGVPVLLTQRALLERVPARAARVLCLDGDADRIEAGSAAPPDERLDPDALAYVIYTSGSTGRPKGAMNAHRGVVNRLLWMQEEYGLGADDVVLQKTPFSFDVSVWEFFWPLLAGARLVLAKPEGHRDPAYLSGLIEREGVTTLHFVPSMLQAFLEGGEPARCASVRRVMCSGEALPYELTERFRAALPAAELHNLYGPTEAAVDVTYWACEPRERRVVPIGRPVANTRLYVLDGAGEPAPAGVPGELFLAGVQVGRGYLGRPELTAARFVPDPFSAEGGGRLYRTGDRARWTAEGEVEYLGRTDFQVKVRGFRIEPGEIEAALLEQEGVREAVVVVRGEGGAQRLVAYVAGEGAADAARLREGLRARLPEHMVPGAVVPLERLPLSPSGKVDRRALPAPEWSAASAYVAPRTATEEALSAIWAEVLGARRVGVDESFFELGGDSILAIQVVARARQRGLRLTPRQIFERGTVARLAELVEPTDAGPDAASRAAPCCPEEPDGRAASPLPLAGLSRAEADRLLAREPGVEDIYPLTPMQEGMLFHSLYEGAGAYIGQFGFTLDGELEAEAFERAWQGVVDRHPVLRTAFSWEEVERPLQVVWRRAALPVHRVDQRALTAAEQEAGFAAYLAADRARGIDPAKPPLMRLALFRTGERRHRLVWTSHHLVLDGWSVGLVYRDVLALYAGEREEPAAEPPRPYRDYIAWLGRQDPGRAEAFWRSELAGFGSPTPLGMERSAAAGEAGYGSCRAVLGRERTAGLRELARRLRVTPATVVQGAWALLLSRYSGEEDVVFGATVSGRPAELDGVERMVGNFINTLPLRVRLDRDATVGAFLEGVQRKQVELREHEHSPLPRVQGWSEVEPGLPLFESFLSFQNLPVLASAEDAAAEGLAVRDAWSVEEANYPVALAADLRGGELALALEYQRARFEAPSMERALEHLGAVLDAFAAGPERRLSGVRVLAEGERASVLAGGRGAAEGFPSGATVHEVIAERAERWRGVDACVCGAERLTYAELLERADRLAGTLRELGVGPEVPVALFLERSSALAVALLAVLRSGGFYVPLDPAYPAERLAFLLEDSGAPVVLTHGGLAAALPAHAARVLLVDAPGGPDASSPRSVHGTAGPENLAYTIYTSGSTGRPKAVMVSHRSLLCYADAMARTLELSPADRILQFASPSFDVMVEEVFPAWLSGAAVVFPEADLLGAPGELARAVAEHGVTGFELPTAFWHEWVRSMAEEGAALPPGVRFVIVGGERVLPERVRQWSALRTPLVHVFGLTETTVTSTTLRLEAGEDGSSRWRNLPVGRPLANVELYVLDREMEPVPRGVAGELYVGGEGVARGYRHRPGLTAERYVPHPLTGDPGRRLYRTGDRVRWLEDGTLEFLGRTDQQVKVRGFRIEPAEVEAALVEHPAVADAVVVAREDEPGRSRLVGYVVPAAGAPSPPELRAFLGERLPGHMVPSAFVVLEALPLTANGKLDHRALPAPGGSVAPGSGHVAPRTPTEQALASIWAEVLGVERVGLHDGYFELGGHSLLAMRVVSRVRKTWGVELPLRALFEAPTVAALAARVEALLRDGAAGTAPAIERAPRDGPLPLSFAQQRLWLVHRLEPASSAYNMPFPLLLRGALDARALRRSLDGLVRRHETLRTVLREMDGRPVQLVLPPGPVPVPVVDLRGSPDPEREAERLAGEESLRPFDLAAGPPLRSLLLRLGEERHVLCFTLHHVASDGWSMGVLTREVSALYAAHADDQEPALPELPVQYADYAVWQRARMSRDVLRSQLGYWTEKLRGAPPLLDLPTDHPRAAGEDLRAGRHAFTLPAGLSDGLRALSRREGTTLFMTMLAAWQALLGRLAGAEDVVVGTPVAGRTRVELEGLIGFFVNMLALRAELRAEASWRELLAEVRETALGAYAHQDLPFERLVEELAPERSPAHAPVFQAVFALEQPAADGERLSLAGVEFAPVPVAEGGARWDLNLTLADGGEALAGTLVYREALFEPATIARLAGHLETLLAAMAADPERRPSEASLLGDAERTRVLVEWNRTEAPYPAELCLHQLFEAQARRTPDAPALVFEEERLTYAELNGRANRLAHLLVRLGVGPEVRVGLCLERSRELVVALLAVLKAGGAYVPLDPGSPPGRLAHMLAGSATSLVLTQGPLRHLLPPLEGVRVLDVDGERARIAAESPRDPRNRATPRNLAYVIHTSGSTGLPKAVGVEHAALVNHMAWFVRDFALTAGDRVLQKTPINFDASVWEFHAPLLVGGCLVVARPEGERDPGYLVRTIRGREITTLQLVPALLRMLLEEPELGACTSLRQLFCGGEALPGELCRRLGELLPEVRLVNLYGPAECCIDSSTHRCGEEDGRRTVVPIGRPVPNTRAYVLDRALQPVPVGMPGELYLGGVQVARGYLGRPAATAERFLPDPFGGRAGARLYRTGDRARWVAGGELEYLGRTDEQVKVRGIRVEPGEIEAVLRRSAGVAECVVVAREDGSGEKRLVAYVVGDVDAEALRAELRRQLPEYLVPGAFVALERLPLTPHGKLDRGALPAPECAGDAGSAGPRTPVEEVLAGVWAQVLGRERVGVEEDFFALGGHSLLAMRVVSRIREVLGVELPLRAVFEAPTVVALAGRVEGLRSAGTPPAPPIRRVPREARSALPLSFAQQRLWFIDRLEPGSAAYNMAGALRLRGRLDTAALRASLDALVERHEALRTVFAERGGAPAQVVHPPAPVSLPVLDLRGLPAAARDAEAVRLAGAEALRPFDLARGPLLRSTLLRLDRDEHLLCFTVHHVASDGWSMDVLVREVSALYAAFSRGEVPRLPELPVQYADYAVWQREWLVAEVLEEQIGYWKDELRGSPPLLEIPTDRPRLAEQGGRAGSHGFALRAETAAELRAVARREGATLFMTLLAGWQALLMKHSGQDDVVVGTPIAGRTRPETEGLIGFFVNMLPMRAGLAGDPTWAGLLGRVREAALGAYTHQELPFERLVEELGVERSLTHSPVFQATFDLDRSTGHQTLRLGDLTAEPVGGGGAVSQFDLELTFRDDGSALAGALAYRVALFEPQTIARLAGHLEILLEAMAADPGRRLSEVSLLRGAERARVLEASRAVPVEVPGMCVHELFREQARRTPDAVAVVGADEVLTYAELERRAERLARVLRREGVGPERVVGIFTENGVDAVSALLGTLGAGGCCLLLDPEHPAARNASLLEDAGVGVVIAQPHVRGRLPRVCAELRVVDPAQGSPVSGDGLPPVRVAPDNAAYVVYTSGSTGRPKGVLVSHGAAAAHLGGIARAYRYLPADRVLVFAAQTFDPFLEQTLAPLLAGASVALRGPTVWEPGEFASRIARLGVTVADVTPAYWTQLASDPALVAGLKRSLRLMVVGGEALPPAGVRAWEDGGEGRARLLNAYGPTEAVVTATLYEAGGGGGPAWGASVPIGRPVSGRAAYVLDDGGEPVPVGVPGELYVGGAALARGYVGRAAQTAEKFLPDALGGEPGARLYRTGDRARWRTDGELEFLGRIDAQVKVRGARIEPGEVEAALLGHAQVREAVVVVREDVPGDPRLVAYVVPAEGAEVSPSGLREHLRERLPEHMVPGAFVALESIPLTPSGKTDRRALPAPEWSAASAYVAPRTAVEERLAAIFAEVLKRERVGVEEGFFELGGHSLLATRVVSRLRQELGVELPLRALFEAPTVAALAGRVEALGGTESPAAPRIPRRAGEGPAPLSFAQQRLWYIHRLDPRSSAYNMPHPLRLRGALDVGALRRSLTELVRRHEAVRTVLVETGGVAMQRVLPAAPTPFPVLDLAGLPRERRQAEALRRLAEEGLRPFDLERGPPLRVLLVRLEAEEWALCFTLHHVAGDGWSMGVLVREVSALYGAYSRGGESPLPELELQYADYAVWQREWLAGERLEAQLRYWRRELADAPPVLELPTDRPRPPAPSARGQVIPCPFPPDLSRGLRALCRREGVTPFMALLAAWQLLLARWAGQEDVSVGTAVAGRNRLELEGLIGFFVNTLVLRLDLSGRPTVREVLRRARETTLGAFAHQDVPFEKLVEELAPQRSLQHTPLFQVMFSLQNQEDGELELGGIAMEPLEVAAEAAKFDLNLAVWEEGDGFGGHVTYRTDLFEPETIQRMVEHFVALAGALAGDPERPAATLPLVAESERRQVLLEWNATAGEYPRHLPVHALFERQAARTPGAPALLWDGGALTYAELDARADDGARALARLGVRPEVRVGVCLERGPELVAALLGVLKAGGVYVPLDPTHPAERLAWLLEDSAVSVLLTDERGRAKLPGFGGTTVLLDGTGAPRVLPALPAGEDERPDGALSADSLAYVLYTSGSTGRPKGVLAPHGGVVNYLRFLADEYGLGPADTVLQLATASFDASIRDILGPLTTGAKLVLVRPEEVAMPRRLLAIVRERGVTGILAIVPSLLRPLLEAAEAEGGADTLRLLLLSGEPLPVADVRRAHRVFGPGVRVVNQWGATECTMSSTLHTVAHGEETPVAPIGRPIRNTRVYVLDGELEPTPAGVPGEAYIATPGLARGYGGRPELTAERFVPDPFSPEPGARMYRVGDRVRWRRDGVLEFLGRMDAQVKVNGARVEPGEVEAVLRAHPGVRAAAVVAREEAPGEARLVGYVVAEEGAAPPAAELRGWLAERLPSYLVPSAFVALDALPLTPSGKLDRRALPAPASARGEHTFVAPRDALELRLAHVWEELLGVPVGVRDDFFARGGHSLLALRLVAAVERLTGRRVPLATLLAGPTVERLARALRGEGPLPAPGALVPLQAGGGERPLFFVHAAGGNVASYAALARHLGPGQPVYGLQSRGIEGEEPLHVRIEEMAADYLAQLRTVQEEGPYRLGGWSMGGLVAFEMARRLEAAGEEVELLALVDSRVHPADSPPLHLDDPGLLASFVLHLGLAPEQIPLSAEEAASLTPGERLRRAWEVAREADLVPEDLGLARFERLWTVFRANVAAAMAYRPEPCASDLLLVLAEERDTPADGDAARWEALTRGTVRSATVAGDHFTVVREPYVAKLAGVLAEALERTRDPRPAESGTPPALASGGVL